MVSRRPGKVVLKLRKKEMVSLMVIAVLLANWNSEGNFATKKFLKLLNRPNIFLQFLQLLSLAIPQRFSMKT